MDVCARLGAGMGSGPGALVEGFAEAEVEGKLLDDLPTKADIGSAAEAVRCRNRKGVEYIVFVQINAIVPIAGIEELYATLYAYRRLKHVLDVLGD